MKGDSIVIEQHHRRAAKGICDHILPALQQSERHHVFSVAGESGSGKSETAAALAEELKKNAIASVILQQDDYFVYAPHSNDRARRKDIQWVGPQEVRLELLDNNLKQFLAGVPSLIKPLVVYQEDQIVDEEIDVGEVQVAIAEGTYTTLLEQVDTRVFIDRTYLDTRAHREKRARHQSELDPFIDRVLAIEHDIICAHKSKADLIVHNDYSVTSRI